MRPPSPLCLLLGALVTLLSVGAQAAPVWIGAAARGGLPPETAQAFRAALEDALARQGVKVLDTGGAAAEDDSGAATTAAQGALEEASAAYSDGRMAEALELGGKALAAFERGPAFSDEKASWSLFRDIQALRALAALSLKRTSTADDAVRALLVAQPDWAPNRKRVPGELLRRVDEITDELRSLPPATLTVESKPVGAAVLVDGRRLGKTPLLVEGLIPGVHYLVVTGGRGRHVERVTVGEDGATVAARLGSRKGAAARAVTELLEKPLGAGKLVDAVSDVDDDALVAVLLPAGRDVEVIGARIVDGEVRVVAGVRVPDNDNDRERATFELVEGLLERDKDAWLDKVADDDPRSLRGKLFGGTGTLEASEEIVLSPAVLATAIIGGAVVVLAAGATAAVLIGREVQKNEGFTFGVDTSRL